MITPIVTMTPDSLMRLKDSATIFAKHPAEFAKAFKATGLRGLGIVQKEYDERSMGKEGRWRPLSEVTVLLRRRGSGKKLKDQSDLNAKKAQPLKDTGLARRSLSVGKPGNILEGSNMRVTWGSRIKYLLPHITGFISTFHFDKEKQDLFFKNVSHLEPSKARKWVNIEKGLAFTRGELAKLPKITRKKKTKFGTFSYEVSKEIGRFGKKAK